MQGGKLRGVPHLAIQLLPLQAGTYHTHRIVRSNAPLQRFALLAILIYAYIGRCFCEMPEILLSTSLVLLYTFSVCCRSLSIEMV